MVKASSLARARVGLLSDSLVVSLRALGGANLCAQVWRGKLGGVGGVVYWSVRRCALARSRRGAPSRARAKIGGGRR